MRLIRDRLCLLALTFLLFAGACPLVGAQEDDKGVADDSPLRQKQEAQERANAMAEDLLERILDKQLQQLEENGLDGESFYKDDFCKFYPESVFRSENGSKLSIFGPKYVFFVNSVPDVYQIIKILKICLQFQPLRKCNTIKKKKIPAIVNVGVS